MKLARLHIKNFRSCRDVPLEISYMHALVGSNGAGKSSVLRALDFLFNPSAKSLNEEMFWNKDTELEIRVEAVFSDLTENEKTTLGPYLQSDGTFQMSRTAMMAGREGGASDDAGDGDDKIIIGQQYKKSVPEPDWLQEANVTGSNIDKWWKAKGRLTLSGYDFCSSWTKKPTVSEWKEKIGEFLSSHSDKIPKKDAWIDNPKGYANVLKATMPFFVLVPAVRDVTEESRGTRSSPFGKLLFAILDSVTADKRSKIEGALKEVSKHMNRVGGAERVALIAETETKLNTILGDLFSGCDLEIEFATPTLEVLLSTPKLFVDDGFRNSVENKGHGLQRAVIFAILRRYADHMTTLEEGRKRNLILAIEEPELYMHPQAQRTIRQVFRRIAEGGDQVLFSTHSSLLVDVAYFDEIIRLEMQHAISDGKKIIFSLAWQLSMAGMVKDIVARNPGLQGKVTPESMRELYSHAYNPRRNEGFFASRIILVEGSTEEYSLPIYAVVIPKCAFDPSGVSVIECGGKGSMDRLFRIFNELHIPCYLLFDYDAGNSDKDIIAKSRELLTLAGEKPDTPTVLLVANGVACFPNKWETDLRGEIPDVDALTGEARKTLGLCEDSGKPLVARYIARKLTSHTPPTVPPSLRKIIEKAVLVTWKKSCLQDQTKSGTYPS